MNGNEAALPPSEALPEVDGIGLCLSGGGYRAAIFHLGALRWLNQCGVLSRLGALSSVSGGSIVAGHLAYQFRDGWPNAPLSDEEWDRRIVQPFRVFTQRNIRTWPVVSRFLYPWNWPRSWSTVNELQGMYRRYLFEGNDLPLSRLPARPELIFCATDMVFGVNWEASARRVGNYEAGYASPPPAKWTLAKAVAASSCFPPVFPPARTELEPSQLRGGRYRDGDREECIRSIRLTDGGVYDNMGLQPNWLTKNILVSDGGGTFAFSLLNFPWRRLTRYPALLQNGIGKLRKQWLVRDLDGNPPLKSGTYWAIGDGSKLGGVFADRKTARRIAAIRTDLNHFTDAEFETLENHGFLTAADKTIRHCPQFLKDPTPLAEVQPPHPSRLKPAELERTLRWSGRRFWPRWWR